MRVENVKVFFDGFKALDVDEFSIDYYELQVVIGPNGAGKTTLCDVISGKTRATSGKIFFAKEEITRLPEVDIARRGVGRKFQTPSIFNGLTVYENMELALPGRQSAAPQFPARGQPGGPGPHPRHLETRPPRQRVQPARAIPQPRPAAMAGNQHAAAWPARTCSSSTSRPPA